MTDDGTLPDRLRNMVRNPNAIGTHVVTIKRDSGGVTDG